MDQLKAPPALALADGVNIPPGELVATFTNRRDLNKAIEYLASQKFPVHTLFVVGKDLRQVDYITGQATYPRAALSGAIQGVGLGALVALFNSLITQTSMLGNFLSIVPLAVAFSMIYSIFVASRAKGKGIRTRSQMLPSSFDLMAIPATAAAARQLLRVTVSQGHSSPVPHPALMHPVNQQPSPQQGQAPASQPPSRQQDVRPPAEGNRQAGGPQQAQPGPAAPGQPQWFDPSAPLPPREQKPEPFLPGFNPADEKPAAPTEPERASTPVFTPPAETNRDGSQAAGKFGLRVENPEEFEAMIRKQPEAPTTNERVEQIRAEKGESRYGLRVETPEEFEATIRRSPQEADGERSGHEVADTDAEPRS